MGFRVVNYREEHKASVIDLAAQVWNIGKENCKQLFEWKYTFNPFIPSEKYMFVSVDNDRVVGFRGFFPIKVLFNNVSVNCLCPCDAVVDRTHRRKGIFLAMTLHAIKIASVDPDISFFLNLSSNEKSTPGYLKLGWKEVEYGTFLFSKTISGYLMGKVSERKIYKVCRPLIKIIDKLVFKRGNIAEEEFFMVPASRQYDLIITNKFLSQEINKIHQPSIDYGDEVLRSEYLKWRLQNPVQDYVFGYLYDKYGKLVCYAIFLKITVGKYFLLDWYPSSGDKLPLLLRAFFRKTHFSDVKAWSFSRGDNKIEILLKSGFYNPRFLLKFNSSFRPQKIVVRPTDVNLSKESWYFNGCNILDGKNWRVNAMDSDAY